MKTASRPSLAGSGLLAVLFTMAVVAALVATVFSVTNSQIASTRRTAARTVANAYADGVMESLYDQWRTAMIGVTTDTDRTSGLSNAAVAAALSAPSNSVLPVPAGVTLSSWSVIACTPLLAPTTDTNGRPIPENGTNSRLRVRLCYLATVNVTFRPPTGGTTTLTIQRPFIRAGRNLFDNFYFGTQPNTEINPGPDMYVSGTVYVGGNLYTAHDSLHFTREVTYTGSHFLGYRPEDSRYGTTPQPAITAGGLGNNWDLNNPPHYGAQQKLLDTLTSSLDKNFLDDPIINDTDSDSPANTNNDGYHEILEEKTSTGSDPLQLDPTTSERLANNADYRIYVDLTNNVTIFKGNSTTALTPTDADYTAIKNAITTNTALKDAREGDNVRLITVDVDKVRTGYNGGTILDNANDKDGLLLYVKDTSVGNSATTKVVNSSTGATTVVTSSKQRGVKLINGSQLPGSGTNPSGQAKGFSVVSPNTVYIQGDYNTGKTSSSQPPSNTATSYTPPLDNPNPYVTGYSRVPAAVAGDAVNILSNNWNDSNSLLSQSSRQATNTTINTAIVAGNVPTTTSSYSGGVENFSRFHENWSGDYLTIYGALALLYNSEQATGTWNLADYSAPSRRWYYDTLLQDSNPPGFRVARTYERGAWTRR